MRRSERWNGMKNERLNALARLMTWLGAVGALLAVVLRVWVIPSQRDIDTGLFATNVPVIGLMLAALAALGALVFLMRGHPRREIVGRPALTLSMVTLIVGGGLILHGIAEAAARMGWVTFYSVTTAYWDEKLALVQVVMPWVQTVLSLLGGAALVSFGMHLASEGGTRRGITKAGLLLPVLWMWFVLANYMMSFVSMVRITDGFFTLAAYIMELLFLYRFACYMVGFGRSDVGTLLFFSNGAALFALSSPLVRLLMHLLGDVEATAAAGNTGMPDFLVGVLALTVSITLCQSLSVPSTPAEEEPEWVDSDELPSDVALIDEADAADFIEE